MSFSYNGWFASENLRTRPLTVAGESFVPGVLDNDDVYTVLKYVAEQMHARVEPIIRSDWHDMDDWGYNYRASTGDPNSLSCHASGTAIDYNATRHPYNVSPYANFTQAQINEIHKILLEVGVVVWGGDWLKADAMHFEINGSAAEVAAAADRIRNKSEVDEMADYAKQIDDIQTQLARVIEQNGKILNKLEGSRQREITTNKQLREIRDSLDSDSPLRRKLDRVIQTLDSE